MGVFRGYRELPEVTGDCKGKPWVRDVTGVTRGYRTLTKGYRGLQGFTGGYNGLQKMTRGYRK